MTPLPPELEEKLQTMRQSAYGAPLHDKEEALLMGRY